MSSNTKLCLQSRLGITKTIGRGPRHQHRHTRPLYIHVQIDQTVWFNTQGEHGQPALPGGTTCMFKQSLTGLPHNLVTVLCLQPSHPCDTWAPHTPCKSNETCSNPNKAPTCNYPAQPYNPPSSSQRTDRPLSITHSTQCYVHIHLMYDLSI
jgi:hypothetical protein